MSEFQALLMGLIQGLTEYLPVSSSGHLTICGTFFGLNGEENLTFTVAVHVATVMSTIVILRKEIVRILIGIFDTSAPLWSPERRYAACILVSMIPVGIVGLFFKDTVEEIFGSGLTIVGLCLIITAALLIMSHYARPRQKENIGLKEAFIIGLAQAVAVMPGLSRSGSTIATGQLIGCKKESIAEFSFLMVIPPILGEALLDILKAMKGTEELVTGNISLTALAIGFFAAFLSGCAACKWMISLVKKGKLVWFGLYCALVGSGLLIYSLI